MAEEFLQGVVCGGNWWNSPRNLFSSSPCSLASANDIGSFGWPSHALMTTEMKSVGSSDESGCSAASDVGSSSLVLHDVHSSDQQPPVDGWNQDLLRDSGRSEENYCDFLLDSSINYRPQMKQSFGEEKQQQPQPLNSLSSSAECMTTCRGQSAAAAAGFPLISSGQDSYSYASSLLQTLFDTDSERQQSLLDHQTEMSYSSPSSSAANAYHQLNSNGFLPSLQPTANANNAPLWNATAASFTNVRPTFPPSPPSHFLSSSHTNHKPQFHSMGANKQHEQGKDLTTVVKKASSEPAFKRPRIETPSPLPTFKVRKEKLGDRITALQQLVSPFGKTDTASVLHEAIEYIKFLHDQVNSLSTPYLKYGSPPVQRQQGADTSKDEEGLTKDLKTRGLCLVPISSTFPVAAETTADFWTPTFSGSFR